MRPVVSRSWCNAGNVLPAVAAIDPKIGIGRQDDWLRIRLGHTNEAGVCDAHWNVRVLLHEPEHRLQFAGQPEGYDQGSASQESHERWAATDSEQVNRLGNHGFTRLPRRTE